METVKLIQQHGPADVVIGRKCEGCVRGAFAGRSFKEGEIVMSIPEAWSISVSCPQDDICSGLAEQLWLTNPDLKVKFKPFFESLPGPDEVLSYEGFNDTMLDELQSPHLARGVKFYLSSNSEYDGIIQKIKGATGLEPPHSYSDFLYLSSILTTRTFSFPNTSDRLIPVGDFLNMAGRGSENDHNMIYPSFNPDNQNFEFFAFRDIEAWEELQFQTYGIHTEKADFALLTYGYIDEALLEIEEPEVCGSDLPSYDEERLWAGADEYDADREAELSLEQKIESIHHFSARLQEAEMQESLQDGLNLLAGSSGWRREVIKFRIVRKKALAAAIKRLKKSVKDTMEGINEKLEL